MSSNFVYTYRGLKIYCVKDTHDAEIYFAFLFSSPEHKMLKVSCCDQSMSVVCPASSTFALKAYIFYTPGPVDSKLVRKHRGDL